MKENSFTIKRLINQRGYYCHVKISVGFSDDISESQIILQHEHSKAWATAFQFGFDCFRQKYYNYFNPENKFIVRVTEVHTHFVDSSPILVFYAFTSCLCEAFDFPLFVFLNEANGLIEVKH